MKRIIAVAAFALATPVLANPFGPTDPVMPAYSTHGEERVEVASADDAFVVASSADELSFEFGPTDPVMPAEEGTESLAAAVAEGERQDVEQHVELDGDYFDPSA